MVRYVFILGNNPELSIAELKAVLTTARFFVNGETYVQCEMENGIDCIQLLRRLGGTIKIGLVISNNALKENIIKDLLSFEDEKKIIFGISEYYARVRSKDLKYKNKTQHLGMEIKKALKERGRNARFVVSRDPVLSSVVVAKNKCQEYMILDNSVLAKTCAVQEFKEYSERDYGRPARDAKSGMLPPKLAKIIINLSGANSNDILLDPFCGSGTVLQEAILLGYKNVIGCDISEKAVEDTRKNIEWLGKNFQFPTCLAACLPVGRARQVSNFQLFVLDVKNLFQKIKKADVIITEPYLGPALRGNETREDIYKIKTELEKLYIDAFKEFFKILKKDGRIVIVMPAWRVRAINDRPYIRMNIDKKIQDLGFIKINKKELMYSRPNQRVAREIIIFEKEIMKQIKILTR